MESRVLFSSFDPLYVRDLAVIAGTMGPQSATLTLDIEGTHKTVQSTGNGPVDATFKAIESIVGSGAELLLYSVNAITTGTDAQGEVTTRLSKGERIVNGSGADTDIVIASARSYLNALSRLHSSLEKVKAQGGV